MVLDLHKSYSTFFPCQNQHTPTCQQEIPTFELDFTWEREGERPSHKKDVQAGLQYAMQEWTLGALEYLPFCAKYMAGIYISLNNRHKNIC